MYMPSIFGENLMDDFYDRFFDDREVSHELYGRHAKDLMRTDVRDKGDHYELDVDLPGFKKEEIHCTLEDGYLMISAEKGLNRDQSDNNGKLVRQERYYGNVARSFYVGDDVTEQDISAKYEDGVLKLNVPKKDAEKEVPQEHHIAIE